MGELVDADVTEVAGPKGKHHEDRVAYRHGTETSPVSGNSRRVDDERNAVASQNRP